MSAKIAWGKKARGAFLVLRPEDSGEWKKRMNFLREKSCKDSDDTVTSQMKKWKVEELRSPLTAANTSSC